MIIGSKSRTTAILEQKAILTNYWAFIGVVAKSLYVRFPEASFIIKMCSFVSPPC